MKREEYQMPKMVLVSIDSEQVWTDELPSPETDPIPTPLSLDAGDQSI
ncbi:MAG: hypothetical protein UHS49_00050 [Faecalimonas sp.]|nr:hypothetical protein [Faecalimonas sp.]